MSTFTDEFQRRLRAVLALRTQAPIPSDVVVEIECRGAGSDDDSRGLDSWIHLRTSDYRAEYDYEEPGAWGKLLADLDAVPDEPAPAPATPPLAFVRVKRLGSPQSPSAWWAWDDVGTRYHLKFEHGIGTVLAAPPGQTWPKVREFEQGTSSHITLDAFAQHAGIDVSRIPEAARR